MVLSKISIVHYEWTLICVYKGKGFYTSCPTMLTYQTQSLFTNENLLAKIKKSVNNEIKFVRIRERVDKIQKIPQGTI